MKIGRYTYEFFSFLRHLRNYYGLHVNRVARQYVSGHPGNAVFIDRKTYIVPPLTSSVTYPVWIQQATFSGVEEDEIFRRLSTGCKNLLDLGAAEGYYSAFFAAYAKEDCRIVAIDLSTEMCRLHREVLEANKSLSGHRINWTIHEVAITDQSRQTTLKEGFGDQAVTWYDTEGSRPVNSLTMRELLERESFIPDLIKIDVESFEYEIITSSIDWLVEHHPRIHLELHSKMMKDRGNSPEDLMSILLRHYKIAGSSPGNYKSADICRLGLVPRE